MAVKIQEALLPLAVPIGTVALSQEVVKVHSAKNLRVVKASLERFGQAKPIVVDQHNVCRAGNIVLLAMQELGATQVAVVRPVLTEEQFRLYEVVDNRSSDADIGSEWDTDNLKKIYAEISDLVDFKALEMSVRDASEFFGLQAPDADTARKEKTVNCPMCGHANKRVVK